MQTLDRLDRAQLERLLAADEFFWLDLDAPTDAELDAVASLLGWHPLAVEDAKEFDQRPKLDEYADHALLVVFGVHEPGAALVEVHIFVSGDWVVTVRRSPCAHLAAARDALEHDPPRCEASAVWLLLDALTDSFMPPLDRIEERLEDLEDRIVARPDREQPAEIVASRREVAPMRRVAADERDLFSDVEAVLDSMPGLEHDDQSAEEFRDLADHAQRNAERLEALRDRLAGALGLYATTNGNRLNEVTEQLTLVATIFLPLTFVVGFFGQNFGWMVDHVDGVGSFLIWGIGGIVVPVVVLVALFRRAGLLGGR